MAIGPHPVPHQSPSRLLSSPLLSSPSVVDPGLVAYPPPPRPSPGPAFAHHARLCLYTQVSHITAERVIVLVEGRGGC
jgi:hypothetical protein